jgi:hypothetical protein
LKVPDPTFGLLIGSYRRGDGMSEEPKKRSRAWLSRSLAALIAIASYETVHYSTVCFWNGDVPFRMGHVIRDKPIPQWVEPLFWPAYQVDYVIGYSYERRPYMCILRLPERFP